MLTLRYTAERQFFVMINILTIVKTAFLRGKNPQISFIFSRKHKSSNFEKNSFFQNCVDFFRKKKIWTERTGISIIAGFIAGVILLEVLVPQTAVAELKNSAPVSLTISEINKEVYKTAKKIKMIITAYSSTPDQTDDTPFITASGKHVADGIIANNLLPFGTKVRIPQLYGDKIFVVEDRMHSRKGKYQADIWMPEYSQAKNFGAKVTEIEVLES